MVMTLQRARADSDSQIEVEMGHERRREDALELAKEQFRTASLG
jgi:hypothetical protein